MKQCKRREKKTNLAQPLHGGCECRAIIEHHPGQKSSALLPPFIWAWRSVIRCAQNLPGVHGDGLKGGAHCGGSRGNVLQVCILWKD